MLTKKLFEELDLLSRHIRVLQVVMENQPIGIMRIAKILGIEEYEVRHSLSVLENNGLIRPTSRGAVIEDNAKEKILNMVEDLQEIENTTKLVRSLLLKLVI